MIFYINHFIQPDSIVPGYSNPQNLDRYSYVRNNPLRYIDPTGHRACGDGEEVTCGGNLTKPTGNAKNCSGDGCHGKGWKRNKGGSSNNGNTPFATVTPGPTATATPSYSTFPGQQCTSANPCLNNVIPSATPIATSTIAPILSSQDVEDIKDLTQFALPSNRLRPNFAPNIDDLWNNLGNALPLINHPAVTSDQIVNSIVDSATKVVEFGGNVIVNYGQYISSGFSPTIPIVPYFPFTDPFTPVYQ